MLNKNFDIKPYLYTNTAMQAYLVEANCFQALLDKIFWGGSSLHIFCHSALFSPFLF